jgi:membrane protein
MTDLLEKMLAVGWVGRVKKEAPARVQWGKRVREETDNWVLLVNAEKIKVSEVYRLFVFGGMSVDAGVSIELDPDSPMTLDAGALARRVEDAVEYGLDQSLADNFADVLPTLGGEPE